MKRVKAFKVQWTFTEYKAGKYCCCAVCKFYMVDKLMNLPTERRAEIDISHLHLPIK